MTWLEKCKQLNEEIVRQSLLIQALGREVAYIVIGDEQLNIWVQAAVEANETHYRAPRTMFGAPILVIGQSCIEVIWKSGYVDNYSPHFTKENG